MYPVEPRDLLYRVARRQGDDKEYADMLNWFRVGKQTEDDMLKLSDRVRKRDHPDLKGAMVVTCTNAEVQKQNRDQGGGDNS